MKRKGLGSTAFLTVLVISLALILAVVYFITSRNVIVNWQLFPKGQEVLDLRNRAITTEEYDALCWQMPTTKILWSVPFQLDYYPNDIEELTVTVLREEDIPTLEYFRQLKTVHAEQCTDYAALKALYLARPDLDVRYTVPIGGVDYAPGTTVVTATALSPEDVDLLVYLPQLKTVDGTQCRDFVTLRELEREHPEWKISYMTDIAGTEFTPNARALEVTGADYQELSVGLSGMPELQTLFIHAPKADSDELMKLREEYPKISIHWDLEVFGNTFNDDATELDISNEPVGSIEVAKEIAAKFPNLEKLIVDSNGIPHEDMAAYRDEVRSDYKVVWTIKFSSLYSVRTDTEFVYPTGSREYYFLDSYTPDLKYLEDCICVDLGEHPIRNIDFVAYMPHLKYLILAWTQVQDISPISNCKELVYLEIDHSIVRDYTPLIGCTALEDITINDPQVKVDVTPLTKMTWLKNLWCPTSSAADKALLTEALPDTRVETVNYSTASGMGWRNLDNYHAQRKILGAEDMN